MGEDEEPSPCPIDALAPRSLPVLQAPASVVLEEIQGKDQGSMNQIPLGRSWMDLQTVRSRWHLGSVLTS